MEYTIPLRITVRVDDPEAVKCAAEASLVARFGGDEESVRKNRQAMDDNLGRALGQLATSEEISACASALLELTPTLTVVGIGVSTSEVRAL